MDLFSDEKLPKRCPECGRKYDENFLIGGSTLVIFIIFGTLALIAVLSMI